MKRILVLLVCAVLLSGCTKSNIVQLDSETQIADPDFEVKEGITIDWQQVSEEAGVYFKDKNEFPYSEDFYFNLQPDNKQIMLVWVVADDLPAKELDLYSEKLLKGFNDIVAVQDFSIEMSNDDSYGGLWKDYAFSYGIAPVTTQDDEETWYASGAYGAGVEFVLPNASEALKNAETADTAEESAE